MTTTQHTPGPWNAGRQHTDTGNIDIAAQAIDSPVAIATCEEWGYGGKVSRKEAAANARLIATAPELLNALRECAFSLESVAHLRRLERELLPIADKARALIAQATGQQGEVR
jgi:hypothetical protein